jgi:nicotinate (nicotinamide) nucleotide adenylyltransferase
MCAHTINLKSLKTKNEPDSIYHWIYTNSRTERSEKQFGWLNTGVANLEPLNGDAILFEKLSLLFGFVNVWKSSPSVCHQSVLLIRRKMASSTAASNHHQQQPPYAFVTAKLTQPDWSSAKQPVVVLSCGSFSPVTFLHLRLFEMARDHLNQGNFDVIGGFASPVSDGYNKKGLAPIEHRLNMVDAALASSSWVAVDRWEGSNPQWTPTVLVLRHFQEQIDQFAGSDPKTGRKVRLMLLCGSDLLDSFNTPNLWAHQDMRKRMRLKLLCTRRLHLSIFDDANFFQSRYSAEIWCYRD